MHCTADDGAIPGAIMEGVTKRPHANLDLIRRVLGNDYLNLEVRRIAFDEDVATGRSKVTVETLDSRGVTQMVEGDGVGLVDALIGGLFKRYEVEYQSLKSIELASFAIQARLDTKQRRAGADAVCEVTLEVRNSEGKLFTFSDSSQSISASSARTVIAAVEYFVNAERAFITIYKSRQDARERNRDDRGDGPFGPATRAQARHEAERQADGNGNDSRTDQQRQRDRQFFDQLMHDRTMGTYRRTEIAAQNSNEVFR
jgi:hypothetical protein